MKPAGPFSAISCLAATVAGLFGLPALGLRTADAQHATSEAAADRHHARPRLIAERAALIPGKTAFLGITFDIDPHWHLYWDGLSDTGMPVQVAAELPEGITAGRLLWPAPKRQVLDGDLLDYIYEDRVTLILPVTVPESATPGQSVRFAARLDWLECKDVCLPGHAEVELTLPVAAAGSSPPDRTPDAQRFDEARARLPVPLADNSADARIEWSGDTLKIVVRAASALTFYPRSDSAPLADPIREGTAQGALLALRFDPGPPGTPDRRAAVSGVVEATFPGGRKPAFYEIRTPIP